MEEHRVILESFFWYINGGPPIISLPKSSTQPKVIGKFLAHSTGDTTLNLKLV